LCLQKEIHLLFFILSLPLFLTFPVFVNLLINTFTILPCIQHCLSHTSAESLIHTYVFSRLDYCNFPSPWPLPGVCFLFCVVQDRKHKVIKKLQMQVPSCTKGRIVSCLRCSSGQCHSLDKESGLISVLSYSLEAKFAQFSLSSLNMGHPYSSLHPICDHPYTVGNTTVQMKVFRYLKFLSQIDRLIFPVFLK